MAKTGIYVFFRFHATLLLALAFDRCTASFPLEQFKNQILQSQPLEQLIFSAQWKEEIEPTYYDASTDNRNFYVRSLAETNSIDTPDAKRKHLSVGVSGDEYWLLDIKDVLQIWEKDKSSIPAVAGMTNAIHNMRNILIQVTQMGLPAYVSNVVWRSNELSGSIILFPDTKPVVKDFRGTLFLSNGVPDTLLINTDVHTQKIKYTFGDTNSIWPLRAVWTIGNAERPEATAYAISYLSVNPATSKLPTRHFHYTRFLTPKMQHIRHTNNVSLFKEPSGTWRNVVGTPSVRSTNPMFVFLFGLVAFMPFLLYLVVKRRKLRK